MERLLTHAWRKDRQTVLAFISRLNRDKRDIPGESPSSLRLNEATCEIPSESPSLRFYKTNWELLTMRRADLALAPRQVPAGIVLPRESQIEALWRVIRQQIGKVEGKLKLKGRLASYLAAPWQEWRHVFYLEAEDSPNRWYHRTPPGVEEHGVTLAFSWKPFQVKLARGQGLALNLLGSPEAPALPWPSPDTHWIEQVLVFARNPEGCLLTFREEAYPNFGIQAPRGPLVTGESPQEAALRLVWEETGLSFNQVRVAGVLGEYLEPHHAMRHHVVLLEAKGDLPSSWVHVATHQGPDMGMRFCCNWSPPDVPLIPYQNTLQPLLSSLKIKGTDLFIAPLPGP